MVTAFAPDRSGSEGTGFIRSYSSRWGMLAIFCSLTFINAVLWICFSPIAVYTQRFYGVSLTAVNMLSVIFMLLYAPGSYLAVHLVGSTPGGLRTCIVVGAVLNAVGAWLRYASAWLAPATGAAAGWGYALLLVGQALPALAQPLFTNVPAKLAGVSGRRCIFLIRRSRDRLGLDFPSCSRPPSHALAVVPGVRLKGKRAK